MDTTENLSKLTDKNLLGALKNLVGEERKIITLVLLHLREVENRRLFATLGFSSLYDYCRSELGYSEASAQRRISAMRLLKEVPEVEKKINSGALTLNVISQAQSFFREKAKIDEPLKTHEKIEILHKFENKSVREVEREIFAMSPERILHNKEKIRAIGLDQSEIKFIANSNLLKKLGKLKALLAHKSTNLNMAELIETMADISLSKLDPEKQTQKKSINQKSPPVTDEALRKQQSRHIPTELRREVWKRDKGFCQYTSHTGKKCNSQYGLEVHHKHAFAKGGVHTLENLTLHCFAHNQLEAMREFGERNSDIYDRYQKNKNL